MFKARTSKGNTKVTKYTCALSGIEFYSSSPILDHKYKGSKQLLHPDFYRWNRDIDSRDITEYQTKEYYHIVTLLLLQQHSCIVRYTAPLQIAKDPEALLRRLFLLLSAKQYLDMPMIHIQKSTSIDMYCKELEGITSSGKITRSWEETCNDNIDFLQIYSPDSKQGRTRTAAFLRVLLQRKRQSRSAGLNKDLDYLLGRLAKSQFAGLQVKPVTSLLELIINFRTSEKSSAEEAILCDYIEVYLISCSDSIRVANSGLTDLADLDLGVVA